MVIYSTETSRLHKTLLKQPMAGPRGKGSNKEGLSTTEGSCREQRFASGAAKGLSPPSMRKVLDMELWWKLWVLWWSYGWKT